MPHYLIQGSYTPETWARLVKQPEDRADSVRPIMESVGGKLEALYFTFGDDDIVAIVELPDNVQAAAISVAVASTGAFKSFKTSVLLTTREAKEVMQKAASVAYRPPGQS